MVLYCVYNYVQFIIYFNRISKTIAKLTYVRMLIGAHTNMFIFAAIKVRIKYELVISG